VRVQSFSSSSQVRAGHFADFAVWLWSAKAASHDVKVSVHVAYALYIGAPHFTVCPLASGRTCTLGNLPVGTADELQVKVKVGAKAALGEQVQLNARATASKALSFENSATDVVVVPPPPTPDPTSPVTALPPPTTLPPIAGTGVAPKNPTGLFPTVGPASSPSISPSPGTSTGSGSIGLPRVKPRKSAHVADVAATVPLDPRLIGGQLAGLAVLAGAVAIAIARLSLRSPKPPDDKKSQGPPQ
jgi:hypothetical protein